MLSDSRIINACVKLFANIKGATNQFWIGIWMKPIGRGLLVTALLIFPAVYLIPSISTIQESVRYANTATISFVELSPDYLTEHSPIMIDSNQDFETFASSGTGDQENPYVIEKLYIVATGSQNSSISVSYTTVHFIIRDCYVSTDHAGIEILQARDSTVRIENNTCTSNSGDGAGIVVWGTRNCTIVRNRCFNLAQGIHLNEAGRCYIEDNNITENNYQGINVRYSDQNIITGNLITNSSQHGLALVGTSRHNIIHRNRFIDNGREETYRIDGEPRGELTSQGFDEGYNNTWYDATTEVGNWWSDYSGDGSYSIDGPSDVGDIYPNGDQDQQESPGINFMQIAVVVLVIGCLVIVVAWRFYRKSAMV